MKTASFTGRATSGAWLARAAGAYPRVRAGPIVERRQRAAT